jgi:hypothetical protein
LKQDDLTGATKDDDGDNDEELDETAMPSPISELLLEAFDQPSGSMATLPAAAAPLLVALREDGTCLVYKVQAEERRALLLLGSNSPAQQLG